MKKNTPPNEHLFTAALVLAILGGCCCGMFWDNAILLSASVVFTLGMIALMLYALWPIRALERIALIGSVVCLIAALIVFIYTLGNLILVRSVVI